MAFLLSLLTAIVAGFVHALEPDHMAAVTTFVSRRPHPLRALGFGVRWGIGHSVAVLVAGGVLILLDVNLPEAAASGLEFGVGAMLFGLGLWLLWTVVHAKAHAHGPGEHGHRHAHHQGRGTLWVGMAHGLAGTAPLLGILPVTLISSTALAFGYLFLFGIGTVIGMGLYAMLAGVVFHHAGRHVPVLEQALRLGTALGSTALGVVWMVTAIG